jgi:hydrogenase maturation protein HypF
VGFRPFVYRLAKENSLGGWVLNHSQGVEVEVEGESKAIDRFLTSLTIDAPPLSRITRLEKNSVPPTGESEFTIRSSQTLSKRWTLISPDTDVCVDCLRELFDLKDRRYRYPFINCTNCGPRFTIICDIPYDRGMTTMRVFTMCPLCQEEFEDPANRRFHAQPNGCWQCGPRLSLLSRSGEDIQIQDPLQAAVHHFKEGSVVAIKGLGGFHLAVDATSEHAVARLRERKHREEKPFALMVRDIEKAREFCEIGEEERALLTSQEKPILLLKKRPSMEIAESVAPHNRFYGIMLPYTPVHHLLLASDLEALVMTSGNVSEEPIVKDNEEALERLEGIADYFLVHNRDIHIRADDRGAWCRAPSL